VVNVAVSRLMSDGRIASRSMDTVWPRHGNYMVVRMPVLTRVTMLRGEWASQTCTNIGDVGIAARSGRSRMVGLIVN
jgi:hypothetical protein